MPVSIPPFTNVPAPNDPVASPWAQQLTQFAVDQYVSQPGTPASAYTELWYDSDDAGMAFPNMPRGYVGHAVAPSVVSGIGATVTDLGAAVTWTADPTRQYKTTVLSGRLDQLTVSSNGVFAGVYDGANTYRQGSYIAVAAGGYGYVNTFVIESGLSGSQTRKAKANTQTGTLTAQAGTIILVEDIGAASQSGGGIWSDSFPRGFVAQASKTAPETINTINTWVDVAGLSATWTADPTRRYRVTYFVSAMKKVTASGLTYWGIFNESNGQVTAVVVDAPAANTYYPVTTITALESGLSGTKTRKGRAWTSTAGVLIDAGNQQPCFVLVEDIGKA